MYCVLKQQNRALEAQLVIFALLPSGLTRTVNSGNKSRALSQAQVVCMHEISCMVTAMLPTKAMLAARMTAVGLT